MSPLEIWCNESQERYVLAIPADRIAAFQALCERERCPFAIVGEATEEKQLIVEGKRNYKKLATLPPHQTPIPGFVTYNRNNRRNERNRLARPRWLHGHEGYHE